jgi:NADPH2:quinone reductase
MNFTAMAFDNFGPPDVFHIAELDLPEPLDSQVLVEVEASSVNFADVMARQGKYPLAGPPYVTGIDFVGRVIKAGSDDGSTLVGKRIVGFGDTGSYATHLLAPVSLVFEIPENMKLSTAAACPLLICTTYALLNRRQGLHPGDNLLIHAAAGGIGLTAIQMAKQLGASSITALVSSSSKVDSALRAGATEVIVTSETPDYPEKVRGSHPDGLELILNSVAGKTIQKDLEILKPGGQIVVFGMASGEPGVVQTNQLHHSSRTVSGFSFGNMRRTDPQGAQEIIHKALPLATSGKVAFDIVTEYSLYDVQEAHRAIESRTSVGKLILIP